MEVFPADIVASRCGLSPYLFAELVDKGQMPKPDVQYKNKGAYSDFMSQTCVTISGLNGKLNRITHLAKIANVNSERLRYLAQKDLIPAPDVQIRASRFYSEKVAAQVLVMLPGVLKEREKAVKAAAPKESRERANKRYEKRREMGFYSQMDVARMNKVSHMTILHHVANGNLPSPTHEVEGHFGYYYNRAEAKKITKFVDKNVRRRVPKEEAV